MTRVLGCKECWLTEHRMPTTALKKHEGVIFGEDILACPAKDPALCLMRYG